MIIVGANRIADAVVAVSCVVHIQEGSGSGGSPRSEETREHDMKTSDKIKVLTLRGYRILNFWRAGVVVLDVLKESTFYQEGQNNGRRRERADGKKGGRDRKVKS